MAIVGELKYHIAICGTPELVHLLEMLEANITVLPGVVVKAMQALAGSANGSVEVEPFKIEVARGVSVDDVVYALSMENQRITPIGGR